MLGTRLHTPYSSPHQSSQTGCWWFVNDIECLRTVNTSFIWCLDVSEWCGNGEGIFLSSPLKKINALAQVNRAQWNEHFGMWSYFKDISALQFPPQDCRQPWHPSYQGNVSNRSHYISISCPLGTQADSIGGDTEQSGTGCGGQRNGQFVTLSHELSSSGGRQSVRM